RNLVTDVLDATGKVDAKKGQTIANVLFPGIKEGKFNLSGAVTWLDASNTASANIAAGAAVAAQGKVDVTAGITDRPAASVASRATSTGSAIGGGAVLAGLHNDAKAWIGADAAVDARGALTVD